MGNISVRRWRWHNAKESRSIPSSLLHISPREWNCAAGCHGTHASTPRPSPLPNIKKSLKLSDRIKKPCQMHRCPVDLTTMRKTLVRPCRILGSNAAEAETPADLGWAIIAYPMRPTTSSLLVDLRMDRQGFRIQKRRRKAWVQHAQHLASSPMLPASIQ